MKFTFAKTKMLRRNGPVIKSVESVLNASIASRGSREGEGEGGRRGEVGRMTAKHASHLSVRPSEQLHAAPVGLTSPQNREQTAQSQIIRHMP